MTKTIFAIAIAAASAFAAAPASAQQPVQGEYLVFVPYGDLDLASAGGTETLDRRLKAAANKVCGVTQAPGLVEHFAVRSCRADVLNAARPQVSKAMASRETGRGAQIAVR